MSRIDKHTISAIKAMFNKLKIPVENQKDIVASFTGDATKTSCLDLTWEQGIGLKKYLQLSPAPEPLKPKEGESQRKLILSICHNLGWYAHDEQNRLVLKDGNKQLDYARINKYCEEKTAAKKKLNAMSVQELQAAINQFKAMLHSHLNPNK